MHDFASKNHVEGQSQRQDRFPTTKVGKSSSKHCLVKQFARLRSHTPFQLCSSIRVRGLWQVWQDPAQADSHPSPNTPSRDKWRELEEQCSVNKEYWRELEEKWPKQDILGSSKIFSLIFEKTIKKFKKRYVVHKIKIQLSLVAGKYFSVTS